MSKKYYKSLNMSKVKVLIPYLQFRSVEMSRVPGRGQHGSEVVLLGPARWGSEIRRGELSKIEWFFPARSLEFYSHIAVNLPLCLCSEHRTLLIFHKKKCHDKNITQILTLICPLSCELWTQLSKMHLKPCNNTLYCMKIRILEAS